MLKPKSPQPSFYGNYLYDRIVHQDHLTGTSVMSDSSGALVSSITYEPFGLTRSGSVPTDIKFTGQRLDGTGLYYYGARYYDPTIGRFISADTVGQHLTNPQTLNRYSYVINNPLRYTDLTGHDYVEDYWGNVYWDPTPPGETYNPYDNPAIKDWLYSQQPEDPTPGPDLPLETPTPGSAALPGPTIPADPPEASLPDIAIHVGLTQPEPSQHDSVDGFYWAIQVFHVVEETATVALTFGLAGVLFVAPLYAGPAGFATYPAAITLAGAGVVQLYIYSQEWRDLTREFRQDFFNGR